MKTNAHRRRWLSAASGLGMAGTLGNGKLGIGALALSTLALSAGGCSSALRLAQSKNPPQPLAANETGNYSLALVLGSGGPRGFAHVGVLKALTKLGIKPDLIVGTSIGSLIGSLYAAGMPIEKIWQLVEESSPMNWVGDVTWHRFGWLTGDALERDVERAVGGKSIEELPTRFVAVATRLPVGERIEFARGSVATAVRASSSIVGTFIPLRIGEHVYGDGDLVAPVPVLTAKNLGAKKIIAIDVSANLRDTPDWANAYPSWIATGIMREQMIVREMAMADLAIRVPMNYYAYATTNYKVYARDCGEKALMDALPRLRELGLVK